MPYAGPSANRRVFITKTSWRDIKDEDKERAATAAMDSLGLSNVVRFDGLWFYLWLVRTSRKNLTEEQVTAILTEANETERKEQVEFEKS